LQACDLWRAASGFHPVVPVENVYPKVPGLESLAGGRIIGIGATLPPNSATTYGLLDVRGYDALENVRYRAARERLALWSRDPGLPVMTAVGLTPESARLFDLFAVRTLVLRANLDVRNDVAQRWGLKLVPGVRTSRFWTLEVEQPSPRVQPIEDALPSNGSISSVRDFRRQSVVEGISERRHFPAARSAMLHVVRDDPEALDIQTESDGPLLVRVSDLFDRGWSATIDGNPTRIFAADLAFRGVFVDRGKHRVTLRYRLPGMPWTGLISLLAIFAAVSSVLSPPSRWRVARRRIAEPPPD